MHYPWWHVHLLTSPMLIALVAVVHVLIAHYAVGGGLFLALETRHAYRTGNKAYLGYLRQHAWFFILFTMVFGALTGVGIWWTIGLSSPLATQTLIQIFVFGWAMEYVFFIIEIVSAFIFFYYWGRPNPKSHQAMGWIYAVSAWMSLVLITGITAFMLNPGGWPDNRNFWVGFFNPQFLPQTVSRTGGAFLLASLYVFLHASIKARDEGLRHLVIRRATRLAMLGAALVVIGGVGWFAFLPESARAALESAASLNVMAVLILSLTGIVFAMLYLAPYRNPGWVSPGFAILFLVCGTAAFATGEFIREAVRKPYIVYNVVTSSQMLPAQIPGLKETGYLNGGVWTRSFVASQYPQLMNGGRVDTKRLPDLPEADQVRLGQVIFQYHCNNCHSAARGYSAVGPLMRGWNQATIQGIVENLEAVNFFMPPFAGTSEEAAVLSKYLETIAPPRPAGMKTSVAR